MPTEKAKELKEKFGELAIEVVDEILKLEAQQNKGSIVLGSILFGTQALKFWQAVKTELNRIK